MSNANPFQTVVCDDWWIFVVCLVAHCPESDTLISKRNERTPTLHWSTALRTSTPQ